MAMWSNHVGLICSGTILCLFVVMVTSQHNCNQCNCIVSEDVRQPRGNINVRPPCQEGQIKWPNPYGAVRLELRTRFSKDFRACLIINTEFTAVRISQEIDNQLKYMRTVRGKSPEFCLESSSPVYLYFEPEHVTNIKTSALTRITIDYDIERLHKKLLFDPLEDCRPCDSQELLLAYCTSDYVMEGNMVHVRHRDDETDIEIHALHLVQHTHRQSLRTRRFSTGPQMRGTIVAPRKCGIQHSPGVFLFTGRVKLGRMRFGCAIPLDQWQAMKMEAEESGEMKCSDD